MRHRLPILGVLLAGALVVPALPAQADPAQPTTYRSEVVAVDPPAPGMTVEVTGGDSFLSVAADPGTEVEVPGYQGEPYVRIGGDGTVEVNHNSPSYWVNADRYGRVGVPSRASVEAAPDWERVGSSGAFGWHDHRIHWMSPQPPPAVDPGQRSLVQEWSVPMVVDGRDVTVTGDLEWIPRVSPIPWIGVGVAAAAAVLVTRATAWGLVVAALLASVVGIAQLSSSPLGVGAEALAWAPPVLALALAAAAVAVRTMRSQLLGVAGIVLVVWAGLRLPTLWMPVLVTELPTAVERGIVAVAAATALAALVAVFRALMGRGT